MSTDSATRTSKSVLRWPYALSGLLSALAAMAVGHLVAGFIYPPASPVLSVGSFVIDQVPTPVKEWAVSTFGTADKPILIGSVMLVSLLIAAGIGLLARTRLTLALCLAAALILLSPIIAITRPVGEPLDAIPGLLATLTMVVVLRTFCTRLLPLYKRAREESDDDGDAAYGEDDRSQVGENSDAVDGAAAEPAESPTDHNARATGEPWTAGRRTFLISAAGTAAGAAVLGFLGQRIGGPNAPSVSASDLPTPTNTLPKLPAGLESTYKGISPFQTPNKDFYRIDIALSAPRVDQTSWKLTVDGEVDNPLTISYDDLLAMPMIEKDITMTCVSNEVGGGYVGAARWLGVPVREVLKKAGVKSGVDQIYSSADDGITISTPIKALTDDRDALLAVGMNGQPLPVQHGFPVRLVTPGLYGFVGSTKWITTMTATTYADDSAYWTDRDWATDAPVLTQSRIDTPRGLATIPAGKTVIGGVSWAQQRGIEKVEVRIDQGEWQDATLGPDAGIDYWRQWYLEWDATPGRHDLAVRATDAEGDTQTDKKATPFPSGATGWHTIAVTVS